LAAYDIANGHYHHVDGQWKKSSLSWEEAGYGFLAGVIIAALLLGMTMMVSAVLMRKHSN
jgi:ABC-type nitrate/sulfonate/bicarbonate transport system permease component